MDAGSLAKYNSESASRRLDLDGMRALSIIAVVAYHASPRLSPGGFAGVDIFFLISGYLITGIIIRDCQRGTFRLLDFYRRRVRRILPALVIVLASCAILGWLYLLPSEYTHLGAHVFSASGFFSNFQLAGEGGYFDILANRKPLLHLWSLAVEEQFYLLWPLLLLLTTRYRTTVAAIILVLCSVSLAYWIYLGIVTPRNIRQEFFLPHVRVWELATGSALALAAATSQLSQPAPQRSLFTRGQTREIPNLVVVAALCVIVATISVPASVFMPNYVRPLLVQLGAAAIVWAGTASPLGLALLANPAMTYIGRISYPLYLWHWPLIYFGTIFQRDNASLSSRVFAIVLAIALAAATYHFVESPLRRARFGTRRALSFCVILIALGGVGLLIETERLRPHAASLLGNKIIDAADRFWNHNYVALSQKMGAGEPLAFGRLDKKVLLIGDSYAIHYWPRIEYLITRFDGNTRGILFATRFGCNPASGWQGVRGSPCKQFLLTLRNYAHDKSIDRVLIAAHWSAHFLERTAHPDSTLSMGTLVEDASDGFDGLQTLISEFEGNGKEVYVVLTLPFGRQIFPAGMIVRRLIPPSLELNVESLKRAELANALIEMNRQFKRVSAATHAVLIDPLDDVCDASVCPLISRNGYPLFERGGHLNSEYVRDEVRYLDPVFLISPTDVSASTGSRATP